MSKHEGELNEDIGPSLFEAPPMGEQERMVEAMLFASAALSPALRASHPTDGGWPCACNARLTQC